MGSYVFHNNYCSRYQVTIDNEVKTYKNESYNLEKPFVNWKN